MAIQDRIDKLISYTNNMKILSCDVVVARPHRQGHKGNIYHIEIRLHVPGDYIIIDKEPEKNHAHEDIYVAVRDAFDALERKLDNFIQKRRGFVKTHEPVPRASIARIFPEDGYGFIITQDGREIYFSENSILNKNFKELTIGQEVRYTEEVGTKGPQVTSMQVI